MIDTHASKGILDALDRFKVANAPPGILDRLKTFGQGQWGAAKSLAGNLRGGLGGQMNPSSITGPVPPQSMDMARASQRHMAMGDLRTLAPSLAIGGGAYMLHRHNQAKDQQARQNAMMMQQGYGGQQPMGAM